MIIFELIQKEASNQTHSIETEEFLEKAPHAKINFLKVEKSAIVIRLKFPLKARWNRRNREKRRVGLRPLNEEPERRVGLRHLKQQGRIFYLNYK